MSCHALRVCFIVAFIVALAVALAVDEKVAKVESVVALKVAPKVEESVAIAVVDKCFPEERLKAQSLSYRLCCTSLKRL